MLDSVRDPKLTLREASPAPGQAASKLIVVSGGRTGVGATTVALGLAQVFARDALRVVLIDADREHATVAEASGIEATSRIDEVLSGRKTIHEALTRGPDGMQILAGSPSPAGLSFSERSIDRLLRQMHSLSRHTDLVLVDAGSKPGDLTARLWRAANELVLITSPEPVAVMDTYALMKRVLHASSLPITPTLVVNQAASDEQASDVHRRIDQSCRRFLQISVSLGGAVLPQGAEHFDQPIDHAAAQSLVAIARRILTVRAAPSLTPLAA